MSRRILPHLHALPPGTCLNQIYQIQSILGEGGFGITYKGIIQDTDSVVAIKEYFPPSLAVRSRQEGDFTLYPYPEKNTESFCRGRTRFLNEAAILRSFQNLESIVSVYDLFEENGTAYLVMEYIEGLTLRQYINENGILTFPEISELIQPVIQSLAEVHEKGLIHRDISPDNLIISTDNHLHLIDFGAASRENHTAPQNTVILKAGFAPPEQYVTNSRIGAWIDVYALCATIYFALTGSAPAEAIHRLDTDSTDPPPGLSNLLAWQRIALEKGLQLRPADRFQNMHALWSALNGEIQTDKDRTVIHTTLPQKSRYQSQTHHHPGKIRFVVIGSAMISISIAISFLFAAKLPTTPENPPAPTYVSSHSAAQTELSQAPPTTTPHKIVTMPDLTGTSLKKAKQKLKKLDPSIRIDTTYSYSDRIPAGKVISQSIKKGISFSQKQFSSLSLTVSKGKKPVSTPTPAAKSTQPPKKPTDSSDYQVKEDDSLTSIPFH